MSQRSGDMTISSGRLCRQNEVLSIIDGRLYRDAQGPPVGYIAADRGVILDGRFLGWLEPSH